MEKAREGDEVSLFPGLACLLLGSIKFGTNFVLLSDKCARLGSEAKVM